MIRLSKRETRSIVDCLTYWAVHHRDQYINEHPRLIEWQTEAALREARKGPGLAPDYCAQPKRLKGRCRGCWYAGDPTKKDDVGCLAAPDVDPEEREKAKWRADVELEGWGYTIHGDWIKVP